MLPTQQQVIATYCLLVLMAVESIVASWGRAAALIMHAEFCLPAASLASAPTRVCRSTCAMQVYHIETWKEMEECARQRRLAHERHLGSRRARAAAAGAAQAEAAIASGGSLGLPGKQPEELEHAGSGLSAGRAHARQPGKLTRLQVWHLALRMPSASRLPA